MDFKRIRYLLEKYWEGETTLLEEKELKEFFNRKYVPDEFREYQSYFVYLDQSIKITLKDEPKLDYNIEEVTGISKKLKVYRKKQSIQNYMKVAATFLILLVATVIYQTEIKVEKQPEIVRVDTYEDPEVALEEAKKALLLVSAQLNSGSKYVVEISHLSSANKYFKNTKKKEE
ncbi:MAG: hypothetical protein KTR26_10280 [Flammeovirgaceae bacterium]|nr:hypothetical protein [Flammeovirgaceae bacterium]